MGKMVKMGPLGFALAESARSESSVPCLSSSKSHHPAAGPGLCNATKSNQLFYLVPDRRLLGPLFNLIFDYSFPSLFLPLLGLPIHPYKHCRLYQPSVSPLLSLYTIEYPQSFFLQAQTCLNGHQLRNISFLSIAESRHVSAHLNSFVRKRPKPSGPSYSVAAKPDVQHRATKSRAATKRQKKGTYHPRLVHFTSFPLHSSKHYHRPHHRLLRP